jgi:hypothetical protein
LEKAERRRAAFHDALAETIDGNSKNDTLVDKVARTD